MSVRIVYQDIAAGAEDNARVTAPGAADFAQPDLLPFGGSGAAIASLEPYSWLLDESREILDGQAIAYWSEAVSGPDGRFEEPPELIIDCDGRYTSPGLFLTFDMAAGDYCTALAVEWYRGGNRIAQGRFFPTGTEAFCAKTVEVYDREKQEWVAKQDVGTTSYTEKEKGQASDSFKRACFNWGIGRELYTAPFIWIPAGKVQVIQKGDRYTTYDRFTVRHIAYGENREIAELVIVNGRGTVVYTLGTGQLSTGSVPVKEEESSGQLSEPQRKALLQELERTGVTLEAVLARYQLPGLNAMTKEVYDKAMRSLKRTKPKQAA